MKIRERIGRAISNFGEELEIRSRYPTFAKKLSHGGIQNNSTGMGTALDKSEGSFFTPTRFYHRSPLEVLFVQSSAARKAINIPIDDAFLRWRRWEGTDKSASEKMKDQEKKHLIRKRLSGAMKAGDAFGSAVMMFMTREAPLNEPLVIEELREGVLLYIRVFDRFDMSVNVRNSNIYSDNLHALIYAASFSFDFRTSWKFHIPRGQLRHRTACSLLLSHL